MIYDEELPITEEPSIEIEAPQQEIVEEPTPKGKKKKEKSKARKIVEWVLLGIFLLIFGYLGAGQIHGMIHKDENYGNTLNFGVGSFIVLTDSMEPLYKRQSALITYKEDFGEVYKRYSAIKAKGKASTIDVTFMDMNTGIVIEDSEFETEDFKSINGGHRSSPTNKVMTHRIREIHLDTTKKFGQGRYIIVTSGINDQGMSSKKGQYQIVTEKQYLGTVEINSPFLGGVFGFITSPLGLIVLLLIPAGYLIITSSIDIFKAMKESEEGEVASKNTARGDNLSNLSEEDKERLKRELLDEMLEERKNKKDE